MTVAICVAGLSYLALARPEAKPQSSGAILADRFEGTVLAASWQPTSSDPALYDIDLGPTAGLPLRRDSRRHAGSGLREDTVLIGSFGVPASHLALTLERGPLASQRLGLFVDLSRRAAPAGLAILRLGQIDTIATKFGAVEAALVTLAGQTERTCLAFRWSDADQDFGFKGWHCPADPAAARTEFACIVDRLSVSGLADRGLKARFAQADLRRLPGCRPPPGTLASRSTMR